VDYKKMAEVCKLKNPASAKASWHGIKKKLDKAADSAVAGAGGKSSWRILESGLRS
jgi:hypothetical protein